jgi:predicted transcriptional regulator
LLQAAIYLQASCFAYTQNFSAILHPKVGAFLFLSAIHYQHLLLSLEICEKNQDFFNNHDRLMTPER